ncbi:tryptophan-rich sensory protein [Ruficoccus amylovorans]|uniref:Tryptophan-rich sensory protein n=1 Tax=Ruficoccus amylovorans TaxID=1804625 RepID=A0A842HF95_9BACT|nr:TspO/MBR family protein [Ruficoccus amylovorans]MBC2594237.1 tryptophan-rich sensory protein [Ruficoccus amylovorans]
MRNFPIYFAFVAVTLGGGLLIGYACRPGEWYDQLEKPSFNPPGWVFAPVWSLLYILIGVAGARVFLRPGLTAARALWVGLLILNFLWTPTFFGLNWPGVSLGITVLMVAGILLFIAACWGRERPSSWLFAPYALWTSFAFVLNGAIVHLNP